MNVQKSEDGDNKGLSSPALLCQVHCNVWRVDDEGALIYQPAHIVLGYVRFLNTSSSAVT